MDGRGRTIIRAVAVAVVVAAAAFSVVRNLPRQDAASVVPFDLVMGGVFVAAAALSARPDRQRILLGSVGVLWWLATADADRWWYLIPVGLTLALTGFPDGRPGRLGLAGAAGVAVLGALDQPAAAFLLLSCVVAVAVTRRRPYPWRGYPVVAAAALTVTALLQTSSPLVEPLQVVPGFWAWAFDVCLVAAAFLHVVASRQVAAVRAERLVGRLTALDVSDPVVGELRDALGDDALQVLLWDDEAHAYVGPDGVAVSPPTSAIEVLDDGPVAVVVSSSSLLSDPGTAAQVQAAVRLAVRAQHRQRERLRQVAQLAEARRRLLDAADTQRVDVARRLQDEVLPHLVRASTAVEALPGDAVDVVRSELGHAEGEIALLVAGAAPADLGDGRLVAVVRGLADRVGVAVTCEAAPGWAASADVEQALFYVASEALTNVLKHSRASHVVVRFGLPGGGTVELALSDDGVGGTDPRGLGLLGLSDRLAAVGGALEVMTAPGAGTTLVARAPGRPVS